MTSQTPLAATPDRLEGALGSPWARVKDPTPIPDPIDGDQIRVLPAEQLQRLLRDNLLPRESDVDGRARWVSLWAVLADDPELTELAFDVLEDLMDVTEDALDDGVLDQMAGKRARKFLRSCEEAWSRLQVDEERPLGWVGRRATALDPLSRRVLEQLVLAIAGHRHQLTGHGDAQRVDERLWAVLADVDLDPAGFRRGPLPPYPVDSGDRSRPVQRRGRMTLPLVDAERPLGWAGAAAAGFKPSARPVLEQLVLGIAVHRQATANAGAVRPDVDETLWSTLAHVGLDPLTPGLAGEAIQMPTGPVKQGDEGR
ncbi:hypothetical protein SAMN05661080_04129 [Modestobacter sp. DSM 44400]|uniref:hypothetical protein n=1 Tax=Modestobacter sp. DSM 44400 TaxID=1550230 RepID=UPI00089A1093|nr:hypothetical protein [Modestobacter sp. DSM 44400]SDY63853.1 hypothetical protein SAMN05661080_04129 [Modestobacter sp. DSM 44400]